MAPVGPDDALDDSQTTWAGQIGELARRIDELTGNHAEIIEHTRASFSALVRSGSSFITNLRHEGYELVDSSWLRLR